MDSAELIDRNFIEDRYTEPLDSQDIFRDPEVTPRVGDEYQVELPPLIPVFNYIQLTDSSTNEKSMDCAPHIYDSCEKIELERVHEKGECSENTFDSKTSLEESCGLLMKQEMDNTGPIGKPWDETEEASFLLGVYIFGKRFDQVKRFIEDKKMGEILKFYYGFFYGSNKYKKWKKKCERRMYGAKIFSGLKQKEFLSRLFPLSSEDCHRNNILEVSKTFTEGNTTLEDYISTLKSIVGMTNLIEAVGIGKRNQDLTRITRDSTRSSQGAKIPIGSACSSLTPSDIVKFIKGDFRLSKTRSNDLFWEAVWPRLLAREWHSEQPKDRNSLVFLMPGIKKFSRRKLIKGDHYFDSITDVLSKVSSEPQLLEFEIETDFAKSEKNIPQMTKSGSDFAKIMVIDTSLAHGGEHFVKYVQVNTSNDEAVMFNGDLYDDHTDSSRDFIMIGSKKRRRLSSCSQIDTNHGSNVTLPPQDLKHEETHSVFSMVDQARENLTSNGCDDAENCNGRSKSRVLIDLNMDISRDTETEEHFASELIVKQETGEKMHENGSEQMRRQSTRNRPLTTKALEALANGYLVSRPSKR